MPLIASTTCAPDRRRSHRFGPSPAAAPDPRGFYRLTGAAPHGQRDHAATELELVRRELDILLAQRTALPPHRRPEYKPAQRLAIVQLLRLRDWSLAVATQCLVVHENTLREWIKAIEGRRNTRLLAPAVAWNRLDDAVCWAVHGLRRLCPEPELGTWTIARHLIRTGIQLSRSTVQRVLLTCSPKADPDGMRVFTGLKCYPSLVHLRCELVTLRRMVPRRWPEAEAQP